MEIRQQIKHVDQTGLQCTSSTDENQTKQHLKAQVSATESYMQIMSR